MQVRVFYTEKRCLMALYAIADTHLSFGTDKPMDSFPGWSDYTVRLAANWRHLVESQDTVVIAGDISWAMKFAECTADFAFLNDLHAGAKADSARQS